MSRIQCKGCNDKPSEWDSLEGYCMSCAVGIIRNQDVRPQPQAEATEWTKEFHIIRDSIPDYGRTTYNNKIILHCAKAVDLIDTITDQLKTANAEARLWKRRTAEAADAVQELEDVQAQLKTSQEQMKRQASFIEKVYPKHRHNHEYFQEDCGLCQTEKRDYEAMQEALNGPEVVVE